jgi:histidinol dehydrogenase
VKTLRIVAAESLAGRKLRARIAARFDAVLDPKIEREVARILKSIRREGEPALLARARALDGSSASTVGELALAPLPEDRGWTNVSDELKSAVELAIANVEAFHRAERDARGSGFRLERGGAVLEEIVRPLRRVGIYVPGGRASYPSTAIMTVALARVAGVAEIAVSTPPSTYRGSAMLRYTLDRLGVAEIWGLGGAQAVVAMACGCGEIRRVDAVVGPGNAWVTAAKRLVQGLVAIDGLMGPSEVVIVAGADADPELVAADLLAQAEHDPRASALLVTTSRKLARETAAALERRCDALESRDTARESLRRYGGALLVDDLDAAVALAAELSPEHLQLVGAEIERGADRFDVAGAVFVGASTPEVFGDYVAGPSHVLPTCGTARFASGLSVATFERRLHRIRVADAATAAEWGAAAERLATAEGLPAHAAAARARASSGGSA